MHTYEIGNSFEYSLQRITYENKTYLERWKYPKDWRSYAETNVFDLISLRTTLNAYNFILESSSSDRQTQSIANFFDFSRSRRNYCVTSPFERFGSDVTTLDNYSLLGSPFHNSFTDCKEAISSAVTRFQTHGNEWVTNVLSLMGKSRATNSSLELLFCVTLFK